MSESTETPKKKPTSTSRAKAKATVTSSKVLEKPDTAAKAGSDAGMAQIAQKPAGESKSTSTPKKATKTPTPVAVESLPGVGVTTEAKSATSGKSAKARAQIASADVKERAAKGPARRSSAAKAKSGDGKSSTSGQLPDQDVIDKMVSEAAYYLAEKRNFATGFEEQDWLAAKEQIMTQLLGAKRPKA